MCTFEYNVCLYSLNTRTAHKGFRSTKRGSSFQCTGERKGGGGGEPGRRRGNVNAREQVRAQILLIQWDC